MQREIKLNGGEITILKSIGLSGTQMYGKLLLDRIDEMEKAEILDTMEGLLSLEYLMSNKVNVRTMEDIEKSFFRVNPAYAKDLRDAINPGRRRDRDRERRQRRR